MKIDCAYETGMKYEIQFTNQGFQKVPNFTVKDILSKNLVSK